MQPALAAITVKLIVFEEQFNSDSGLVNYVGFCLYLRFCSKLYHNFSSWLYNRQLSIINLFYWNALWVIYKICDF